MTLLAVGSYTGRTGGRGVGITLVEMDGAGLRVLDQATCASPSFLAWGRGGRGLYAAHETRQGAVSSWRWDGTRLRQQTVQASAGGRPCHLALHPSGSHVVASNYAGGTYASLPLDRTGGLQPANRVVTHHGHGTHPQRQDRPHPHSATYTPDGAHVVLSDVGLDTLSLHTSEDGVGALVDERHLPPGTGPRHATWLEEGLVVVGEIDATLSLVAVDDGRLHVLSTANPTSDAGPDAWPSEIASIGDDRVLVANRTAGTLATHTVSPRGITLEHELGLPPSNVRHVAVIGDRAVVALQDSDTLAVLDLASGAVVDRLDLGSPAYIAPQPSNEEEE